MSIDSKHTLNTLLNGTDLEAAEMEALMGAIMDGGLESAQVAALLVALRAKGESATEVAAAARVMKARALGVTAPDDAIDTCGTGGDGTETINISTASALVAAAGGVPVAKHGNRSVSSRCGSADVLEALGVRLELDRGALTTLIEEIGIAFLFAQQLHPAMAAVAPVRRALGVRTVFNLLGPLTNPAGIRRQVLGVWGGAIQPLVAEALAQLGAVHALVVHSDDGLDEFSVVAPTTVIEVRDGAVTGRWMVDPAELGIRADDPGSLRGGDVDENASRMRAILSGEERSAATEAVALNAAAALMVGRKADDLAEGLEMARELLASGTAGEILDALVRRSKELGDG